MRKFRPPLWTLSVLVLLFAVAFGALKKPSESVASAVFSLVVLSLGVAPVVAVASTGRGRLAWLAFSLVGTAYLGLTFFGQVVPTPRFVPSGWVAAGLDRLEWMMDWNEPQWGQKSDIKTPILMPGTDTGVPWPNWGATFADVNRPTAFRQIGHSLATLMFGLVAAIIVLIMPARKHASGRP